MFAFEGHKSLAVAVLVSGSRSCPQKSSQVTGFTVAGADFLCRGAREDLGVWGGSLQGFGDGRTALRLSAPWIVPRTEHGTLRVLTHPCWQLRETKDLHFPGNDLVPC